MAYSVANDGGVLARRRRAEVTGSLGAGVLGAGLGAALGDTVGGAALPLIVLGGVMHAWGMWDKHRLETAAATRPRWDTLLYWTCWVLLLGLGVYLIGRRFW